MKNNFFAMFFAGLWIVVSEFVRNEFLLKSFWVEHYSRLNLEFITLPVNGILWTVWSFVFAWIIYKLLSKFAFGEVFCIAWTAGFVLMWFTLYNLQVLPLALLIYAIPLSLLEVWLAQIIILKLKA
jgi:hypothetical protein